MGTSEARRAAKCATEEIYRRFVMHRVISGATFQFLGRFMVKGAGCDELQASSYGRRKTTEKTCWFDGTQGSFTFFHVLID